MNGKEKDVKRKVKKKMAILTADCDRMFSVAEDQISLFKAKKGNTRNRKKADVIVSKLAEKIIVEGDTSSDDNA